MENIVEKLIAKKAELRVTNAWIADKSKVPESTVTKVLNHTNKSPSFATIIPMAEALGVPLTPQAIEAAEAKVVEQVTEQIAEEVQKPTPSQTIAEELDRQYARLLEEKDKRIEDKNQQIRQMWIVVIVFSALFLLCFAGFIVSLVPERSIQQQGWIQAAVFFEKIKGCVSDIFSL